MATKKEPAYKIGDYFADNLALLLAKKIEPTYKKFNSRDFVNKVKDNCTDLSLTQRVELIADNLRLYLPVEFEKATAILRRIMGPENEKETGMFTNYYWLMPVGKFVEKYGLDNYTDSVLTIEEITKRNTGEYAIRPFIRKYPIQTLKQMKKWAKSKNFHLRRLASEGLRPKLPWAAKLDLFIEKPEPVFEILELLKEEPVKFVQKSVANHVTDYIKVNPFAAAGLINKWKKNSNPHTQWIIKHASRKYADFSQSV
jgi:3-methyladenine DNA glycosylase AlkC